MATVKSVMSRPSGPYDLPLRCKVLRVAEPVHYTNANGQEKIRRDVVIGDKSGIVRCRNYDPAKDAKLKEGHSIVLKNYITKGEGVFRLVFTSSTLIYKGAEVETVPGAVEMAEKELFPPPAPFTELKDVKRSPIRSIISVKGQIVQEEMVSTVTSFNKPTKVKGIVLKQDQANCRVSLWRQLTDEDVKTGDFVSITNCVVTQWNKDISLNTTDATSLSKIEMPEENLDVTVVGVEDTDSKVQLLTMVGEDFKEFTLQKSLLAGFDNPEKLIEARITLCTRGSTVLSIDVKALDSNDGAASTEPGTCTGEEKPSTTHIQS